MALATWWKAKENSRQRLGACRERQVVSPGGKGASVLNEFLRQKGDEQFPIKPGLGALLIVFRQVAELGNLLKALEDQFDLPAKPIASRVCSTENSFRGNVVSTMTYWA